MPPTTTALPISKKKTKKSTNNVAVKNSGAATKVTEPNVKILSYIVPGNMAAIIPRLTEIGIPIAAVNRLTTSVFSYLSLINWMVG